MHYHYQKGGALKTIDLNGQRLTGHRFAGGLETLRQQGSLVSHYQYDEQGRLQDHAISQLNASGSIDGDPLYRRHYRYDANGNLSLLSDSRKGQKSYAYDPLDCLTEVRGKHAEHFIHDPAGNLLDQSTTRTPTATSARNDAAQASASSINAARHLPVPYLNNDVALRPFGRALIDAPPPTL